MYKKIIPLMILLLFVLGCSQRGGGNIPDVVEYHKGTDGLSIEFVENLPPAEVWRSSDFTIGFKLRNKGPYSISDGVLSITGLNPEYITLEEDQLLFDLEARSAAYPEGDYKIVDFKAQNINFPPGSDTYNAAFTAKASYDYETEAIANVCINPHIYSYVNPEPGCEVQPVTLSGGQGGPIAVTKVEERVSPAIALDEIDVEFKIFIANKGKGKSIEKTSIEEVTLSNKRIACNLREIELKDKEEKSILCKTTIDKAKGAYIAPLTVRLSYFYTQKLDKSFKIIAFTE